MSKTTNFKPGPVLPFVFERKTVSCYEQLSSNQSTSNISSENFKKELRIGLKNLKIPTLQLKFYVADY